MNTNITQTYSIGKISLFFLICFLIFNHVQNAFCQNRSSIWHFGENVELGFCSENPVLGVSPLSTGKGCVTITDASCT